MLAASTVKPKEREFVVDSGANMHMVSKNDLNSAEVETVRISKNPTTVVTANGEVQTKAEATVYVRELDLFVTVMLRRRYTGSSFTRKTLRRSRVYPPLDQWSETTSHQKRQEDQLQHGDLRTVVLALSTSSSTSSSPTSPTSSSHEAVTPTEHPASTRSDSMSD